MLDVDALRALSYEISMKMDEYPDPDYEEYFDFYRTRAARNNARKELCVLRKVRWHVLSLLREIPVYRVLEAALMPELNSDIINIVWQRIKDRCLEDDEEVMQHYDAKEEYMVGHGMELYESDFPPVHHFVDWCNNMNPPVRTIISEHFRQRVRSFYFETWFY